MEDTPPDETPPSPPEPTPGVTPPPPDAVPETSAPPVAPSISGDLALLVKQLCVVAAQYHPATGDSIGDMARKVLEALG